MSKRFDVSVKLCVVEKTESGPKDYFGACATYHDLNYGGLVSVEKALLTALAELHSQGEEIAKSLEPIAQG